MKCPYSFSRCGATCPYTFDDCEACGQCSMLNETAPQELTKIADGLRKLGFFIIRKDDKKIYQLKKDKTIKGYTCSQLCNYLKNEQEYDEDTLEMIERVDNIIFIASYLPILY